MQKTTRTTHEARRRVQNEIQPHNDRMYTQLKQKRGKHSG